MHYDYVIVVVVGAAVYVVAVDRNVDFVYSNHNAVVVADNFELPLSVVGLAVAAAAVVVFEVQSAVDKDVAVVVAAAEIDD